MVYEDLDTRIKEIKDSKERIDDNTMLLIAILDELRAMRKVNVLR